MIKNIVIKSFIIFWVSFVHLCFFVQFLKGYKMSMIMLNALP